MRASINAREACKPAASRRLPTHTVARNERFSALIGQYVFTVVARAVAESMANENAARFEALQGEGIST